MKKIFGLFAVGAASMALASCSSDQFTIAVWTGNDTETAALDDVITSFEEKYGVETKLEVYGNYNEDLVVNIAAGNAPDVFYLPANQFDSFYDQGILADISYLYTEEELAGFSHIGAYAKDGAQYGITKDYSTLALYYNAKMALDCGVTESELANFETSSYEQMIGLNGESSTLEPIYDKIETCDASYTVGSQSYKYSDSIQTGLTFNVDLARNEMFVVNAGSSLTKESNSLELSNIGSTEVVNVMQPIYERLAQDYFATMQQIDGGWNGDAMVTRKTFAILEGNWVIGHLSDNGLIGDTAEESAVRVVEMPEYAGTQLGMIYTNAWSKYSGTKYSDTADDFIKYVSSLEGQMKWAGPTGVIPGLDAAAEELGYETKFPVSTHYINREYGEIEGAGKYYNTINTEYQNQMLQYLASGGNFAQLMKKAEDDANSIITASA